ncbi:hypothetical protein LCGC14_2040220 [marine sediment metagenome]|uniref:THIF-type NAD/FAD binding fold domain-containing protein n=1 Tax=marine sediment metagenome TaxID=412755 RepID=A0A0F9HP62_9ZZZZ
MKLNEHGISYRTSAAFEKTNRIKACICGAGALGSNLTNNLIKQGVDNV